ncbi:MAG: alpha-hydroxy-acid oxidizing protein [Nitrososphaerales archaeon]|nr:alpha-hydroxy-acid oxidizing protein [Nitrososphaerales archaeon]
MNGKRLGPRPAPPRYPILHPHNVERSDRCINCGRCISACIYGCHERSESDVRTMADPKASCCRSCFACVLQCPRGALEMHPCAEYAALGDHVYTPSILCSLQEQASAGRIPVSGAGYGGPFDGEDYDNIWTDMSEIVRPTRDGIHGREHISTTVHLGRTVSDLCGMEFDSQWNLKSLIPPSREIPIPVLFGSLPFMPGDGVISSLALAASQLTTYLTLRPDQNPERYPEYFNHLLVRLRPDEIETRREILEWATMIEIEPDDDPCRAVERAHQINPHLLTILRVPARRGAEGEVIRLSNRGAEAIHLSADMHGRGQDGVRMLECLRDCHRLLVEQGVRDRVTLLASGGIAAAEHIPKTIILGADAVIVDVPLLVAMECTVCGKCRDGEPCPRSIDSVDPRWGAARVINLMLSWRDQLLEVLGAMGMRDIRRLRGEAGRAVFADVARKDFIKRLAQPAYEHRPDPAQPGESHKAGLFEAAVSAPGRFPSLIGSYKVLVDRSLCTDCGICADSCRYRVHRRIDGRVSLDEPLHSRCIGPECLENDWCCVNVCPWHAVRIEQDPVDQVLGDRRWTASLLRATWRQARTGEPPRDSESEQMGASGGGFDAIRLARKAGSGVSGLADLSIPLNRRPEGLRISIPIPIYGGGMSFGSISLQVMLGRAMAAQRLGTFTSTGEGGYPAELFPFAANIITQVATGLFGVREETILCARFVEFKYAQGAKPGLGGHLLAEKNTPQVAAMREAVPGTGLFSPFPFHSVYSVEDHKKHVDWLRAIHPDLLVSVKVSTPADVDMVAVGSYYAGANVIHLDGSYGGTGAAPDIAKKNIAQPIEYATAQVHDFLVSEGIRDEIVLMVSGGVRTAEDVLKSIALGADGVVLGTAELVAIDCVRCGNCERDRGCPIGIATTDPGLAPQLTPEWVRDRIVNLYKSWAVYMQRRLRDLSMRSITELRGRRDLLEYSGPIAQQGKYARR